MDAEILVRNEKSDYVFQRIWEKNDFFDVILSDGYEQIPAHKLVLALHSSYMEGIMKVTCFIFIIWGRFITSGSRRIAT